MTFEEILDRTIAMLGRRGRLTYRTLKRQFELDDAALDDLREELVHGQRLAIDGMRGSSCGLASQRPFPLQTRRLLRIGSLPCRHTRRTISPRGFSRLRAPWKGSASR